jgi:hypothetical protein
MSQFLPKVLISALLVAGAAELARRSTLVGALLASLPLTSILAMIRLWHDGASPPQIADFSGRILWFVLPSLLLFIITPLVLRSGSNFRPSRAAGCAATAAADGIGACALRWWANG